MAAFRGRGMDVSVGSRYRGARFGKPGAYSATMNLSTAGERDIVDYQDHSGAERFTKSMSYLVRQRVCQCIGVVVPRGR
jgi:hypothetical protein